MPPLKIQLVLSVDCFLRSVGIIFRSIKNEFQICIAGLHTHMKTYTLYYWQASEFIVFCRKINKSLQSACLLPVLCFHGKQCNGAAPPVARGDEALDLKSIAQNVSGFSKMFTQPGPSASSIFFSRIGLSKSKSRQIVAFILNSSSVGSR